MEGEQPSTEELSAVEDELDEVEGMPELEDLPETEAPVEQDELPSDPQETETQAVPGYDPSLEYTPPSEEMFSEQLSEEIVEEDDGIIIDEPETPPPQTPQLEWPPGPRPQTPYAPASLVLGIMSMGSAVAVVGSIASLIILIMFSALGGDMGPNDIETCSYCCGTNFFFLLFGCSMGIGGIVTGIKAMRGVSYGLRGRGKAIAGIVLGSIGSGGMILLIVLLLFFSFTMMTGLML